MASDMVSPRRIEEPAVLEFPKQVMRGRKVNRGPCAQVIAFPTSLTGDELKERWGWLWGVHHQWGMEHTDGALDDPREAETPMRLSGYTAQRVAGGVDEHAMRRDINRWVQEIESRNALKDRLEAMGASAGELCTAEAALRFLFNRTTGLGTVPAA